ncbi:MAG: PAS domain S-box protein [Thermodesulfobacteriota bacterium]|nr:PAS domain S-box protein [Thermodesulfobacteriota bacterium]
MEKDFNSTSETASSCPVTGLRIFQRPEWKNIPIGKEFSLTISVIGKHILFTRSRGYCSRKDSEISMKIVNQVLDEILAEEEPYIHVADYSKFTGASIAARKHYMGYLKKQGRISSLIFFGAKPLVNMSIKLVKRITKIKYDIQVADDYEDAIKIALDKEKEIGNLSTNQTFQSRHPVAGSFSARSARKHSIERTDWNLHLDGFSIRFEILGENIIHTVAEGFLREEHVEPLHQLRTKVIDSIHLPDGAYSIISDVSGIKGGSRKARRLLMASIRDAYKEKPFDWYIFYGVNWFTKTALNLARPFLPFKAAAVRDFNAAMRIIGESNPPFSLNPSIANQQEKLASGQHAEDVRRYVNDLIHCIGSINWEQEGVEFAKIIDASHPFKPVFDGIAFIKRELDDFFRERDKIEQELKLSKERYQTILQSIQDGYYEVDLKGSFTFVNDSMARILGYSKDTLIGMNNREYMDQKNAAKLYGVFNMVYKTGLPLESIDWEIAQKDGSKRNLEASVSCIKDSAGHPIGFRGIVRDITMRKNAELALKQSEENYRQLFFSEADAIIIVDLKTRKVVEANPSALSLYRCDHRKMVGLNILEISAEPAKTIRHIESIASGTESLPTVKEMHRKMDDTIFPVEISHGFYNRHDGKMLCTVIRDITAQKEAEQIILKSREDLENRVAERTKQLARANEDLNKEIKFRRSAQEETLKAKEMAEKANQAKSEFLANMSHELRTPLNHIIGFTELVMDKTFGDLNEMQEEYLNDVHHSSMHLLSLINDILDLSKVEAGKLAFEPTGVQLHDLLEGSLIMVKEKAMKHGIKLSTEIKDIPEVITADERKLKQILYNLLSNAVKFTPNGGEVVVNARMIDCIIREGRRRGDSERCQIIKVLAKEKRVHDREYRNCLQISVSDTGIGIKPENQEHIFNPFDQVDSSASRGFQGTGLGLSLSKRLVELHNGKIWVESEGEGKGSAFRFVIPVSF